MRVLVAIECENDAFRNGGFHKEVARLLKEAAAKASAPREEVRHMSPGAEGAKKLLDINGTTVGFVTVAKAT